VTSRSRIFRSASLLRPCRATKWTISRAIRDYQIGRDTGLSKTGAAINAGLPAVTGFVGGFAMLWMGQFMIALARESLFNGEQWEKHRKDGDLFDWLAALSLSRTGIAGPADVLVNAFTGLKYERDLSNLFTGPGFSSILSDVQNIASLWTSNSPKTNTAERNAAKGFYRMIVAPMLSGVLSTLNVAGPVGAGLRYGGMMYLTSNAAAASFADIVAGPQAKKRGAQD